MPPRARTTGPEFMSSATLGDLIAAELETLAAPPAPQSNGHADGDHSPVAPALTPRERARQSMLNRAAAELREHHEPAPSDS